MQVKGEAIEEYINDKDEAYQCCISTIKVAYQRHISTTYQFYISTIGVDPDYFRHEMRAEI
jgi:hypothetical protein